jgi:hypothetical protein
MNEAIGHGFEAPADVLAEIEALRDVQAVRAAEREAAERVGLVDCNRVLGELVRAEFQASQNAARANPQWFATPEFADSAPQFRKSSIRLCCRRRISSSGSAAW